MKQIFKIPVLLLLLLCILLFGNCRKKPESCIISPGSSVRVEEEVLFKSCSENAYSYHWSVFNIVDDLSEVASGNEAEFRMTFPYPDTYKVELRANSKNGKKSDYEKIQVDVYGINFYDIVIKKFPFTSENGSEPNLEFTIEDIPFSFIPDSYFKDTSSGSDVFVFPALLPDPYYRKEAIYTLHHIDSTGNSEVIGQWELNIENLEKTWIDDVKGSVNLVNDDKFDIEVTFQKK